MGSGSDLYWEYKKIRDSDSHNKTKVCCIINSKFCYVLKVDGLEIPFQGSHNVEYFEEHYKNLGYWIVREEESNYK